MKSQQITIKLLKIHMQITPKQNRNSSRPFQAPVASSSPPGSPFAAMRLQGWRKAIARVWDNNYATFGVFGLRAFVITNADCFVGLILIAHERKPAQSHEKVRNSSCTPPLKSRPGHPFQRHKSTPHSSPCAFLRAIHSAFSNIELEIC